MYLVVDPMTRFFVFTEADPRTDGFAGPVEPDVQLDELETLTDRGEHATAAVPCLGRSIENQKHYKVFESTKDCRKSGFDPVGSIYGKFQCWSEYQTNP